jgi:hypothetical protein
MKHSNKDKRLNQLGKQTQEGLYGNEAIKDSNDYNNLSGNSIETFLKNINDFYSKDINPIFRPYPIALIKIILSLFFKNMDKKPELSDYFTLIFQKDIEGTKNTCIKDKYLSMLDAGHASKQAINTNNPLIIWELAKNYCLAFNEFMNILVGVILINYRFSIGKSYKLNALTSKYGNKVNELINLNPDDESYKYLIELMRPDIRNAIGHQTIWFNKEDNIVTFLNDKSGENEIISIKDFIFLNSKASYFGEAYLVAMSTIGIFTIGKPADKARLPKELFLFLMDVISPK